MIKSAASLPLPPLLTQLPLTHHTTSNVLEICPQSSYRKTFSAQVLHNYCLWAAAYSILSISIANCLVPFVMLYIKSSCVHVGETFLIFLPQFPHISLPFNLLLIFYLFCSASPTQKDSLRLLLVTWPAYTLHWLHVHCMHPLCDPMNVCIIKNRTYHFCDDEWSCPSILKLIR